MLHELSPSDDVKYWLKHSTEERLAAVDFLRKQFYGNSVRLQRSARVIQRA
jgi:hypothetical protein